VSKRHRSSARVARRSAALAGGVITGASVALTTATGILGAYMAAVSIAAGCSRPARFADDAGAGDVSPSPTRSPDRTPTSRFRVMIPAHNEQAVIHRGLQTLQLLDYPADLFEVHVVADNCSDDTADIVRRHGFTAHERVDAEHPGKGPALNWLFDRLDAAGDDFDAVVVVDADTSVHPDFLKAMDTALQAGHRAAQGYYGVLEPSASTSASIRYAALACRHHLRPAGRQRLGGSVGLYGNGMMFSRDLMQSFRWTGHLTEDMELQNELLLAGIKVAYVPGAAIAAEMPNTVAAATGQNERWERGRIEMAQRYVPELLRRVVTGPSSLRVAHVDAVLDHVTPPLSVLVAADAAALVGASSLAIFRGRRGDKLLLLFAASSCVVLVAHVLAALRAVGAPKSVYRSLLAAPRMIVWKLALWARVATKPEQATWERTTRNDEVTNEVTR
jgi:1,2-diacylglycerol 3-beta-glucosyltransferase